MKKPELRCNVHGLLVLIASIFPFATSIHLPSQIWSVYSGNKCIVLLHILAHASMLGEKTVVFSQSLKVCMGQRHSGKNKG